MNKFDEFMKKALLISIGITAVSGILIFSYMNSKDLSFEKIFNRDLLHVTWGGDDFLYEMDEINVNIRGNFSEYDTIVRYEESVFDVVKDIEVHASTESIHFIHEERDDIRVTFQREVPDTSLYDLEYTTRKVGDTLIIRSQLKGTNLHADQDYTGDITLYVPEDFSCDDLYIRSAVANDDITLPDTVNNLEIYVNFGSLKLTTDTPMERLEMHVNAGNMTLTTNDTVKYIKATVDAGEINFNLQDTIGKLTVINSLGAIDVDAAVSPTLMDVRSSMGDVSLSFEEPIKTLTAELNLGDLDIDVPRKDSSVVYIKSDLVDITSVLDRTEQKGKANVFVDMNLGKVNIH